MNPEEILSISPNVLSQRQREDYFEQGYLLLESILSTDLIDEMRIVTDEWVARSRSITKSDAIFDLEPGHTADDPRLRRLSSPVQHDERYWSFASASIPSLPTSLRHRPPLELL